MAMNKNITTNLDMTPCSLVNSGTSIILLDYKAPPCRLSQAVILPTCIWVVPDTNLSKETNYPKIFVVFLGPSR